MFFKVFKKNIQIIPELFLPCASQCLVPHTPKFRFSQSPPSQVHMYNVQVKYQNISKLHSKLIIKMVLRENSSTSNCLFVP